MEFLGLGLRLKIDFFYSFIDHGVRSNFLLENAQLLKGYFAEFQNVFYALDNLILCYHKRQYYLKFISKT